MPCCSQGAARWFDDASLSGVAFYAFVRRTPQDDDTGLSFKLWSELPQDPPRGFRAPLGIIGITFGAVQQLGLGIELDPRDAEHGFIQALPIPRLEDSVAQFAAESIGGQLAAAAIILKDWR